MKAKTYSNSVKDVVFKNLIVSKEREICCVQNLTKFFLLEKFESVNDSFYGLLTKVGMQYVVNNMYVLFFYLRNIGLISSWTLSFESLIIIANFHCSFAFAYLNRELDLWERDDHLNELK
jgi:hypothetical protein